MPRATLTPEQKQQALEQQHQLLQATLDYLLLQPSISSSADDFAATHFRQLKTKSAELLQKQRLAQLKKWLRDLSEVALLTDDGSYVAYVQQATGLTVDMRSSFEQRVADICQRKRIRSRADYDDVRAMIDHLDPSDPANDAQLTLLYELIAVYEGFLSAKDIGKPRPAYGPGPGVYSVALRVVSPDGEKALTFEEAAYTTTPEYNVTGVMLNFLKSDSGSGVYQCRGIGLGLGAYWKDNETVVIETKASYEYAGQQREEQAGGMYQVVRIEYIVK